MSFIKALMNFLRRIFGRSTVQTTQTTQTIVLDSSKEMSEENIQVLVQGHSIEEQGKIRKYITGQEAKGIYNYVFETSRWKVTVQNGQFFTGKKEQEGTSY